MERAAQIVAHMDILIHPSAHTYTRQLIVRSAAASKLEPLLREFTPAPSASCSRMLMCRVCIEGGRFPAWAEVTLHSEIRDCGIQ